MDATTLEANAAMRSIVRRDDGTGYEEWLEQVARASGIETPTRQDLAALDRKRPKKGSNQTMTGVQDRGLRSYMSEPNRGRRKWKRNPDAQKPTYANRRRMRGNRGKRLLRQRGEKLERGFAHMLETGGLRRVHVRGQKEIRKRMLVQGAAFNLGLLMHKHFGFGTPRGLQGLAAAQAALSGHVSTAVVHILRHCRRHIGLFSPIDGSSSCKTRPRHRFTTARMLVPLHHPALWKPVSSTGC